jgi:C1A family cysteine protease
MDEKDSLKSLHLKAGYKGIIKAPTLPSKKDLRGYCSPVEDQGNLGSCTANAGVGIVEYYEKRALGRYLNASRLFLYKASRNLMHLTGDTGAYIRTTMGALVLFGVPPEEYWPYTDKPGADPDGFDREPPAFCYAFAQNYQAMQYFRLDSPFDMPRKDLLDRIKTYIVANIPSMFGFTVYSSITQATSTGKIPYPTQGEEALGGHAVVTVGYDNDMEITNTNTGGLKTKGAFLIRNSWSTRWGDAGYGWLPYEYVLKWLARDWWSLLKSEWIDTGMFKFP